MKLVIWSFLIIVAILLSEKPAASEESSLIYSSEYTNVDDVAVSQAVPDVDSSVSSVQTTEYTDSAILSSTMAVTEISAEASLAIELPKRNQNQAVPDVDSSMSSVQTTEYTDSAILPSTMAVTEISAEASLAIGLPNRNQNRTNRAEIGSTYSNIMPSLSLTLPATTVFLHTKVLTSSAFEKELMVKEMTPTISMPMPTSFIHLAEGNGSDVYPSHVVSEEVYESVSLHTSPSSSSFNDTSFNSSELYDGKEKETNSTITPDTNFSVIPGFTENVTWRPKNYTDNVTAPVPESTSVYSTRQVSSSGDKTKDSRKVTTTSTKYIILVLQNDCERKDIFPNLFAVLNTNMLGLLSTGGNQNVNINTVNCDALIYLKFSVDRISDSAIKAAAEKLSRNLTIGDFKVIKAVPADDNSDPVNFFHSASPAGHMQSDITQREIIACIVAAVCAGLLFLTLIVCCCVRFVCQKQTKSLDLCDIPHLNLKLEDYKLTPIPRPTITCPEYGRELFTSTYNGRRSRTENTILSQHHFSGDAASTMGGTMGRDISAGNQEMRTFSGKRPCSRVQSLDVRPNRGSNGWISSSREKLNTDFERKNSGIDNAGFRKWF